MNPYQRFDSDPLRAIFGVLWWGRSYSTLLYIMIAFPLGLLYFVFFTVGFSLGAGLAIVWIGVPVLVLMLVTAWGLSYVESALAHGLLGDGFASTPALPDKPTRFWPWLKSIVMGRRTWLGLLYMLLKFPLGLATWTVTIILLSVSFALLLAPVGYFFDAHIDIDFYYWYPITFAEHALCGLVGLVGLLATLHLTNAMGYLWAGLSRLMLDSPVPLVTDVGDDHPAPPVADDSDDTPVPST